MMMKVDDFNITGREIPKDVIDKLNKYHIQPVYKLIADFNPYASQKSGYRPVSYELSRGRNGNSQHCFKGKGAVDWTCPNFVDKKDAFLEALIRDTKYTRFALYNGFIHCDYRFVKNSKRQLFSSNSRSKWVFIRNI